MAYVHKIQIPEHLAQQFSRGQEAAYNSYCFAYMRGNYPEFQPVLIKGKQQEPYKQNGIILATYKPRMSPAEIAERRAENKKARAKK